MVHANRSCDGDGSAIVVIGMNKLLTATFALSALLLPSACTVVTLGPGDTGEDTEEQVINVSIDDDAPMASTPAQEPEDEPGHEAPSSQPAGCDFSHPSVGATGELITRYHGVSGLVTVLDDCTLLVEHFEFDGNGLDVRLYGAQGGQFASGFPLSSGLYNWPVGYSDDTLEITLPDGVTLDDFDSVSIWCVSVDVSFGDATLTQP